VHYHQAIQSILCCAYNHCILVIPTRKHRVCICPRLPTAGRSVSCPAFNGRCSCCPCWPCPAAACPASVCAASPPPCRPHCWGSGQSASVNDMPCIIKLTQCAKKLSGAPVGSRREENYRKACRRLTNEKQRQRRPLLVEMVDRFKKEQPVIDSERQLSGKVVDEDTRGALERSDQMTPEQLLLIDAILTLPKTSLEKECQQRIAAINAVTAYCGMEEGQPCRRGRRSCLVKGDVPPVVQAADLAGSALDIALSQAILSIKTNKRPTICFLCLGNPALPIRERTALYATPGSLSRHFLRQHARKLEEWEQIDCQICNVRLEHRQHLQNHAEKFHRTVLQRNT
jgi:hypothetical protein